MIFTVIVVSLFVFKAPDYAWLSAPICLAYLILKSIIKQKAPPDDYEYDEFDWWQDNQGL